MSTGKESKLWALVADVLDIPKSLYERATDRHRSLGEWLCRPASTLGRFSPLVRPQGSFRYGTVINPIDPEAEFDLDHVVVLQGLDTTTMSQQRLKEMFGTEIAGYAAAHGMRPPSQHNRCWRLAYRDEVGFHLDSLPCVPADKNARESLRRAGVDADWALRAVAITDRRHPTYREISPDWLTSNPRGFARWFESRAALGRDAALLERIRAGTIEDVPPYEWKTPLQRSIQILKRHRDVSFQHRPELAPISMIITNLAATAYRGETNIQAALVGIVAGMPDYVRATRPRVPNPTHPNEDYADKWSSDPRLERSFWEWHEQVRADLERLPVAVGRGEIAAVEQQFKIGFTRDQQSALQTGALGASVATAREVPQIVTAARPWAARAPRME